VFVHESQCDEFVKLAREVTQRLYPTLNGNGDYTRIINSQHCERLQGLVRDAVALHAKAISLGAEQKPETATPRPSDTSTADKCFFSPLVLLEVNDEMQVMQEEIFGPILPVLIFRELEDALRYVNDHAHPLALYYFDHDARRVDRVLSATTSGGVTVNDVIFHIAQNNLPFGGVGASGMGHYHGRAGFETFSKKKGVFLQSRFGALKFLRPPYGPLADRLLRFLLRR